MNSVSAANPESRKVIGLILVIVASLILLGIQLVISLKLSPLGFPDPANSQNAFFVTITKTEPAGLLAVLFFAGFTGFTVARGKTLLPETWVTRFWESRRTVVWLAVVSFAISSAGVWLVMHHRALAADENMPDFQGTIFLSGKVESALPKDLQPLAHAFKPLLANVSTDEQRWTQSYLPVYAALRTPFLFLRLQSLVNPLLGLTAIFGVAGICRILWPGKPWLAVAGAGLTALSPQIVINDMTSYAMPAHLALNTLWLWLFLQPEKKRFWLAPLVGVLATGLHSPFVHALFVAPFLLKILMDRRWKAAAWFTFIYTLGCAGWYLWWHFFVPSNASPSSALFRLGGFGYGTTQTINFLNLFSWSALPMPLLIGLAIWKYRHLPPILRYGALSCLLSFSFYAMICFDQGLGWGNRYFYGPLGCFILLAVYGLDVLIESVGKRQAGEFLIFGLAASLCLQIPLRGWQVENFVRPYAVAQEAFRKMKVDLIICDPSVAWYSSDLRRNNPTLSNRPLIANLLVLNREDAELLRQKFSSRHFVTREELAGYGLATRNWQPATE